MKSSTSRLSDGGWKRAQAGLEFMTVLGVVLIIFLLVGLLIYRDYVKGNDLKIYMFGQRLSNHVADNINSINSVSEGFSTTFLVPGKMVGEQGYNINFYPNESTVFIEGNSFESGRSVRFSSPLSTHGIYCLFEGCNDKCNRSADHTCLQINDTTDIRLVKFNSYIYLAPDYNVLHKGVKYYVEPFEELGDPDPYVIPDFVASLEHPWNVMYIHHNTVNHTLSMVFSMNLTDDNQAFMDFSEIIGPVISSDSNEASPVREMYLSMNSGARWEMFSNPYDIDGGVINFGRGFHMCIQPLSGKMPTQQWQFLSADGQNIELDELKEVCVTYP